MAQVRLLILYYKCLDLYVEPMQKAVNNIDPYFSQTELLRVHNETKNASLSQVLGFGAISMKIALIFDIAAIIATINI